MVAFEVLAPLRSRGSVAVEAKMRAWFDAYAGDIGHEVRARGRRRGDVGFCSSVSHVSGR